MSFIANEPYEAAGLPILIASPDMGRFLVVSTFGIAILTTSPVGANAARPAPPVTPSTVVGLDAIASPRNAALLMISRVTPITPLTLMLLKLTEPPFASV